MSSLELPIEVHLSKRLFTFTLIEQPLPQITHYVFLRVVLLCILKFSYYILLNLK
jgi:hypothetical protein